MERRVRRLVWLDIAEVTAYLLGEILSHALSTLKKVMSTIVVLKLVL
jgi:hypothetical protein